MSIVTAVQTKLNGMPSTSLYPYLEAIDVLGGAVTNTSGVITIGVGNRALSNSQYQQLYEMIGGNPNT